MFYLIKKDFLASKITTIFALLYVPFFGIIFTSSKSSFTIDNILIPLAIFISFSLASADINYSQNILSLPISRKKFIASKYLFSLIYSFTFLTIGIVESILFKKFLGTNFRINTLNSIEGILITISITLIIISIALPTNLLFPISKKRSIINIFLVVGLFALSGILLEFSTYLLKIFSKVAVLSISSILCFIGLILYFLSFKTVYKIYKCRDI